MTWDVIDLLVLIVSSEAIVELWKKAAPLQGIRELLVRITPFLYSQRQQTHLLTCPYCLSVYAGFAAGLAYLYMEYAPVRWLACALAIHRTSNWLHLLFSLLRDLQIDRRLGRKH